MSAVDVVQAQFDAYNARDARALADFYAEDATIAAQNGAVLQRGRAEILARHWKTFADYPRNRALSVNRMVLGDVVINHEKGERTPEGPFFEAICVYTIRDGLIARVDFIK